MDHQLALGMLLGMARLSPASLGAGSQVLPVSGTCPNKLLFSPFSSSCPRSCSHPCSRYSGPSCNPSCAALTSVCHYGGCSSINPNSFQGTGGHRGAWPHHPHVLVPSGQLPMSPTAGGRGLPERSRSNSTCQWVIFDFPFLFSGGSLFPPAPNSSGGDPRLGSSARSLQQLKGILKKSPRG